MGTSGKFKRYLGNLADDTKELFDEILDRAEPSLAQRGVREASLPAGDGIPAGGGTPAGGGMPAGGAASAAGQLAGTAAAAGDLAKLPQQLAQLSEQIGQLLAALQRAQGVADLADKASGRSTK